MAERPVAMRGARWGEALYGVPAFLVAMALPMTPEGIEWFLWAHWLGTALVVCVLAWRLRRPTRATWYAAALLSAYVLAYSALTAPRGVSHPDGIELAPRPQCLQNATGTRYKTATSSSAGQEAQCWRSC